MGFDSSSRRRGQGAPAALREAAARLERTGDLSGALELYERALAKAPTDAATLRALARLAGRMEMHEAAAALWARLAAAVPVDAQIIDAQARALIAAARFEAAIDVLRDALMQAPGEARLWDTLGVALTYDGRAQEALAFFDEAIRLDPERASAFYNRSLAWTDLDQADAAEQDLRAAGLVARQPFEQAMVDFGLATVVLARGGLAEGWPLYERRLSPDWPRSVVFEAPGKRWRPGAPLGGRSLMLLAEQGLGDEILFANVLPDVIEAVGPAGRVILAAEPRLQTLFARSFPDVEVVPHVTDRAAGRPRRRLAETPSGRIDLWAPLASLPQQFRTALGDFPRRRYLTPDPARVAHWRAWLGDGPAVGVTWRSGKADGDRRRHYPPPPEWTRLLQTPGVRMINLQYGDCVADLEAFAGLAGRAPETPPGLNLKDDIDELAALCAALDLVVSVQNATGALAGACGARVLFLAGPGAWTQLGAAEPPWYAHAQVELRDAAGSWTQALTAAAEQAAGLAARPS